MPTCPALPVGRQGRYVGSLSFLLVVSQTESAIIVVVVAAVVAYHVSAALPPRRLFLGSSLDSWLFLSLPLSPPLRLLSFNFLLGPKKTHPFSVTFLAFISFRRIVFFFLPFVAFLFSAQLLEVTHRVPPLL